MTAKRWKTTSKPSLRERLEKILSGSTRRSPSRSGNVTRYEAPVTIRRQPMTRPLGEQGKSKKGSGRNRAGTVRRRYERGVPGTPGASITLPQLPQIQFTWRTVSFFIVLFLSIGLYGLLTSATFRVEGVQVDGLKRIKPHDLLAVLGVDGKAAFLLNPGQLQETLLKNFPEFEKASVTLEFPAQVAVSVTERKPVLILQQSGRTDLLDAEGVAFPLRSDESGLELPILQAEDPLPGALVQVTITETQKLDKEEGMLLPGLDPSPLQESATNGLIKVSPELVKSIFTLFDYAPQGEPLIYTAKHGFGWKDSSDLIVYFGDASDLEMKLKIYQAILQRVDEEGVRPEMISVEWVDAPYYRLEP